MPAKTIFFVICFSIFLNGLAQDIKVEDRYDEYFYEPAAFYISLRNAFHPEDFMLGTEVGIMNAKQTLIFFGSFDARPYRKKISEYQGNNIFYQYAERRYFAGIGAEYLKSIRDLNIGVFIQMNIHYTWGKYGGTYNKPDQGFVITPKMGFYWRFSYNGFFKVGYAYLDTKSRLEKHRLTLTISGILSKNQ